MTNFIIKTLWIVLVKKQIRYFFIVFISLNAVAQDHRVNGRLFVKSTDDRIATFQTLDDKWLYTEWKNSAGDRRAYVGLSENLSEFIIGLENGTNEFLIPNGNVGVGTHTPLAKLHIQGDGVRASRFSLSNINDRINDSPWYGIGRSNFTGLSSLNNSEAVQLSGYYGLLLKSAAGTIALHQNGKIGIGTTTPDSKLTVKGNIHAEEIKVDLSVPAPDYVFKKNYNLIPLKQVQQYINKEGHLPNISSAKELKKNGVELGVMNMKLLEKIEELTLYVIEQKKDLELKNSKIIFLSVELEALKKRMNKIDELVTNTKK